MKSIARSSSPIILGAAITLILVFVGSLLTATVIHFTQLSESNLPYFTYSINALSLLIGGFIAGRMSARKGWYFGGISGITYFVLVFLIGFLALDLTPHISIFLFLTGAFMLSALGGMLGVNLSPQNKT